ncbi:pentatricopeptide repeat-containing protein At2g13600-like [Malania oleifera]|uniref:pentatricopeptide repeat-containing protein At2g13600-like n=1 Tax=Malania oleifera TaxID=397392 RepID=UPI0025AD9E46|nr:pentatricopeptide repeat-containing protein At2g13600-like [Malania oleifera]
MLGLSMMILSASVRCCVIAFNLQGYRCSVRLIRKTLIFPKTLKLSWQPFNYFSLFSRMFLHFGSNQENLSRKLMPLCDLSARQSYVEFSNNFCESMKACSSLKSTPIARKLHAQLISTGLESSIFLQNHLLDTYSNCGLVDDAFRVFRDIKFPNVYSWNIMIGGLLGSGRLAAAEKLFDEMPVRDVVSWNSMMSGYFNNGQPENTVKVFALMIRDFNCVPDHFSFARAMKACASLGYLSLAFQLHGMAKKFDFGNDMSVEASIVDMYIKCGAANLAEMVFLRIPNPNLFCWNSMIYAYSKLYGADCALDLFFQMPEWDTVSWNTMISILAQHGLAIQTLEMFVEMWGQGFRTNSMTYANVLSVCTSIPDLDWGAHLHARIIRMETSLDVFIGSGLIDMYAKCGCLKPARRVFDSLTEHNAVSWTSLIRGMALFGLEEEALSLFNQMREAPVAPDEFTLATVLGSCSSPKDICLGGQLHACTVKLGMDSSIPVRNALITMYGKCRDIQKAIHMFEFMAIKDIISWTAMISVFSQHGYVDKAREYFNKMPAQNVITWNSMLMTYTQHGLWEEGFKLFVLMLKERVKLDWITFAASISACANSVVLKLGNQIIAQANKLGFDSNVSVANSVITMYSRCGQVAEARKVFDSIAVKNLISWNAMMAGYAQNGQGREVIDTLENMLKTGCTPDHVSFVAVLSGCSHSGLVLEGQHFFNSMVKDHGITPVHEHYVCMVDLLGRAGMLEQAVNMIDGMLFKPNAAIWGALLGACRIHGSTELAELALKNLLELDAEESGGYVLLANMYSDHHKLEGVANVRKLMREKGIQKNPGCSWIEVDNTMHVFTADDSSHPQINDVYRMLEDIIKEIEDAYYKNQFC